MWMFPKMKGQHSGLDSVDAAENSENPETTPWVEEHTVLELVDIPSNQEAIPPNQKAIPPNQEAIPPNQEAGLCDTITTSVCMSSVETLEDMQNTGWSTHVLNSGLACRNHSFQELLNSQGPVHPWKNVGALPDGMNVLSCLTVTVKKGSY
jgi:hypothetical protein